MTQEIIKLHYEEFARLLHDTKTPNGLRNEVWSELEWFGKNLREVMAERDTLKDRLYKYGRHTKECNFKAMSYEEFKREKTNKYKCNCGFVEYIGSGFSGPQPQGG